MNIILFNFYEINDYVFGNFSSKVKESFIFQLRKLNMLISDNFSNINRQNEYLKNHYTYHYMLNLQIYELLYILD